MGDIESNQFGDPEMGCSIEAEIPENEQPKSENSSDFDSGIDFDIQVVFYLMF